MSDTARPGEIELEASPEPPAPVEAPPEPEAPATEEPAAEDPAGDEPAEEPAAEAAAAEPAKPAKPRLVDELRQERAQRKQLEQQIREVAPILQRLTPELQQAILEGRALAQPPANPREVETARLTQVAEKFGLLKQDGTPDLETAKRVDNGIRDVVREEVAPIQHQTMAQVAMSNMQKAVAFAEANGHDVETVRETFQSVLKQPNGVAMLADPNVAGTIWYQALGRAAAAGKVKAPAAQPAPVKPPVVGAEGAGRRPAGQAAIRLSPAVAKVYRENGIDPATSYSTKIKIDNPASIELE